MNIYHLFCPFFFDSSEALLKFILILLGTWWRQPKSRRFFLSRTNVFTSCLIYVCSNVSFPLLKWYSLSLHSVSAKMYLTSIDKVDSRLYKNGKNFVEVCLLTLCVNETPSVILGQSRGFPSRTFTNDSLMVLFCPSQSPFDSGWYALVVNLNSHTSKPTYDPQIIIMKLSNGGGTFIFVSPLTIY